MCVCVCVYVCLCACVRVCACVFTFIPLLIVICHFNIYLTDTGIILAGYNYSIWST